MDDEGMARMGGERKEGDVMSSKQVAITILNHCGIQKDRGDEFERRWFDSTKQHIAAEIDREVKAEVAELVGLLRRVDDAGLNLLGCDLMADIKAAIAKHGGNA